MQDVRAPSPPFTRTDWDRLPEGFPAQLVDGWLLKEPGAPYGHQCLAGMILASAQAVAGMRRALPAPFDVWIDDLNVFQPDVVVLRECLPLDAKGVQAPLLVVEVLSPSTARRDRDVKRVRLLEAGTDEVWLVDPEARAVEIHTPAGSRVVKGDECATSRALPGFTLVPSALFAAPD